MNADILKREFERGKEFAPFLDSIELAGHRPPWDQRFGQLKVSMQQKELVNSFSREMNILSLTGPWCGDCALQGSAFARIAEVNPGKIQLRFIPRADEHAEVIVSNRINAGFRVPVTWLMAEDFQPASRIGDRTLSRYRSIARKTLGDQCNVYAPPPDDPVQEVLQEVLNEIERVQLLLRLSPRLRQLHGD